MNIAVLTGISRGAGGVYYAVSALCQHLVQAGEQIAVLGSDRGLTEEDCQVWNEVDLYPYTARTPLGLAPDLGGLLQKRNPNLVHQHGLWLGDQWAGYRWQQRTGNPLVVSPHGMLDPWALQNSAWKKKLVGRLFADDALKAATCIHALCDSEVESIRAYGLKNPVCVIPNGVELPAAAERSEKPQGEKKQILFMGRIHPKKGITELVEAWAAIQTGGTPGTEAWQLVLAGWDERAYLSGLRKIADQAGLTWLDLSGKPLDEPAYPADIIYAGPRFSGEKTQLLQNADAFILPSYSEGLPMSVLEAWSYALPVIMTKFCNLPAGFREGAALDVSPEVDSITDGVKQFMQFDRAAREQMGQNGRRLVEREFTWERIAGQMKAVYQWSLNPGAEVPDTIQQI